MPASTAFEECGFERPSGLARPLVRVRLARRAGGDPHLVGERERHVTLYLVGEDTRRLGVEVRLVLDGDDSPNPVGVAPLAPEFDAVPAFALLDDAALGGGVDGLADVAPRVARVRKRVAVVGSAVRTTSSRSEFSRSVPNRARLSRPSGSHSSTMVSQRRRLTLTGDEDPAVRTRRLPVAFGPPTDA